MAVVTSSSTPNFLRHFLRRPQQPHFSLLSPKPLSSSSSTSKAILPSSLKTPHFKHNSTQFFSPSPSSPSLSSPKSLDQSLSYQELEQDEGFDFIYNESDTEYESEFDSEGDEFDIESNYLDNGDEITDGVGGVCDNSSKEGFRTSGIDKVRDLNGIRSELYGESEDSVLGGKISDRVVVLSDDSKKKAFRRSGDVKVPTLTVKEKKELAFYAHGLGNKLKCQLVGKSGVTDNVATSFIETLEANELLKVKIHRTCPGELEYVVQHLEAATGSVVVGQIGRTVIMYRPSLTKLKKEEKRKQNRRIFVRRSETKLSSVSRPRNVLQPREQTLRSSGRGRRGSSRA